MVFVLRRRQTAQPWSRTWAELTVAHVKQRCAVTAAAAGADLHGRERVSLGRSSRRLGGDGSVGELVERVGQHMVLLIPQVMDDGWMDMIF